MTQQFTALYTFAAYFEHTNFLYAEVVDVDFYGSYYCGIAGAIANFFGAMMLFFDEEITKPISTKPNNLLFKDFRFKKPKVGIVSQSQRNKYEQSTIFTTSLCPWNALRTALNSYMCTTLDWGLVQYSGPKFMPIFGIREI